MGSSTANLLKSCNFIIVFSWTLNRDPKVSHPLTFVRFIALLTEVSTYASIASRTFGPGAQQYLMGVVQQLV